MSGELIGILSVGVTLLAVVVALATLILQQLWSLRADMKDMRADMKDMRAEIRSDIQALDARLRVVEMVQAQHGLLLQQLTKQQLDLAVPGERALDKEKTLA
ncbi:MAG: hypothetical protein OXD30_05915 [Bryobacterales bacterium]|nr:hypothetical protein [Bryobacterales bacterium]